MLFSCQDVRESVHSIADSELDEQEHAEVVEHLKGCPNCHRLVASNVRFKELIKQSVQVPAPAGFRDKILAYAYTQPLEEALEREPVADVAEKAAGKTTHPEVKTEIQAVSASNSNGNRVITPSNRNKVAVVILAAAAVLLLAIIPQWTVAPATTEGLSVWEESVDWHRSDIPMEVQGPNAQGVVSWFHGKVNFNVEPISFGKNADAVLIGGRLASVHNRRAALLNYRVDDAVVTVLVFDGKGISVPPERLQSFDNQKIAVMEGPGYDIALFHKDDLTYTITTDLPSSRFERLVQGVLSSN